MQTFVINQLTVFDQFMQSNIKGLRSLASFGNSLYGATTGLVSSGVWGEGASLALVGYPSSDSVMIKMPYGVDVLHRPASHPIFSYWVD